MKLADVLEPIERNTILAVWYQCGRNQSLAARRLGITRPTIRAKLKSYHKAGFIPPQVEKWITVRKLS